MKRKTAWLLMLAVLVFSAGAGAGKPPDPEDESARDEKALQGSWSMTKAERDGKEPGKDVSGVKLVVEGKKMTIKDKRDEPVDFTLDAKKKPREITMSAPGKKKDIQGIYKLDKETLTLCFAPGGEGARPTDFSSTGGRVLLEFKRDKKDK